MNKNPTISFVIPCFNEDENISYSYNKIKKIINLLIKNNKVSSKGNKIIYVDDGSSDKTWLNILQLYEKDKNIKGIKLSSNFGHQNAILAGLHNCDSDISISIDCDLQDNLNVIEDMIDNYSNGRDIVYGVKKKRVGDSLFKRITANIYYYILKKSNNKILHNHADFRLVSKKIIKFLNNYNESNVYLRGLIPELSSNYAIVKYDLNERKYGKTKYSFSKMIKLGINGITSYTDYPLKLIFNLGFLICIGSFIIMTYYFISAIFFKETVKGWPSIVLPIYFLGGIQLLCLSIIAQYVSKIFYETKKRPRYLVEKIINE